MDPVKVAFLLFSVFLIPAEILTSEARSQRHPHQSLRNGKEGRWRNTRARGVSPHPLKQLREDLMEKYEHRLYRVRRDSSEEHLRLGPSESESESSPSTNGGGQGPSAGSSTMYGAWSSQGSQSIIRLDFGLFRHGNRTSNSGASCVSYSSLLYSSMILLVLVMFGWAC